MKKLLIGVLSMVCFGFVISGVTYLNGLEYEEDKSEMISLLSEECYEILVKDSLAIEIAKSDSIMSHYQAMTDSAMARIQLNFDYVFPKFKVFNPDIDTATTWKFASVMNAYELDITDYKREMYTGQILLESGAKQYRPNGDVVVSSAGAIGFCQILPSTALGYMQKYIDSTEVARMYLLGADNFAFAFDDGLSKPKQQSKCREWLLHVNNNITMWGFITKNNLDRKGDIHKQLVAYNMGTGGMKGYIAGGGIPVQHSYIRGIRTKLIRANKE